MSPDDFRAARKRMGLTSGQLAAALGYKNGENIRAFELTSARARRISRVMELAMLALEHLPAAMTGFNRPARAQAQNGSPPDESMDQASIPAPVTGQYVPIMCRKCGYTLPRPTCAVQAMTDCPRLEVFR